MRLTPFWNEVVRSAENHLKVGCQKSSKIACWGRSFY
jgi:hypothetical protein